MIKSSLTPPTVTQATVDHYVIKGRRERSKAIGALFGKLFNVLSHRSDAAAPAMGTKLSAT